MPTAEVHEPHNEEKITDPFERAKNIERPGKPQEVEHANERRAGRDPNRIAESALSTPSLNSRTPRSDGITK